MGPLSNSVGGYSDHIFTVVAVAGEDTRLYNLFFREES
jgi:hypothetical protein